MRREAQVASLLIFSRLVNLMGIFYHQQGEGVRFRECEGAKGVNMVVERMAEWKAHKEEKCR